MKTRQLLPLLSAAVLLCAGSACFKAIKSSSLIVHPNLNPSFGVSSGGTARWVSESVSDKPFQIHFIHASPCDKEENDLKSQPSNKVASCKIPAGSDGAYKYEIRPEGKSLPLSGPIFMHVDGCKGCRFILHMHHHQLVTTPPTNPGDPDPVYLDCDPGQLAYADPKETKVYPGQTLQWAPIGKESILWKVSNIPATICDGEPFNNDNPYCVIKAIDPTTLPYTHTYNIDRHGCAKGGTAILTILPPPRAQ